MGRKSRFVSLNTVRKNLADGEDWIEIKEKLSYGEEQKLASASLTTVHFAGGDREDTEVGLDMQRAAILRIQSWVTDWSFVNEDDRRMEVSRETIESLDPDVAEEINEILNAHIKEMDEKKSETHIIEIGSAPSYG